MWSDVVFCDWLFVVDDECGDGVGVGVGVCAKRALFVAIESIRNKDRKRTTNTANSKVFLFFIYITK